MPHNFVASVMDDRNGQRGIRGSVIFKSDVGADHPGMAAFTRQVMETIPAFADMLEDYAQTVVLVSFAIRDPLAILDGDDCKSVFTRQYTEHVTEGRA